jgi:hypothetical protein
MKTIARIAKILGQIKPGMGFLTDDHNAHFVWGSFSPEEKSTNSLAEKIAMENYGSESTHGPSIMDRSSWKIP